MMNVRKLTNRDIKKFIRLYAKYESQQKVADITGWSKSTVFKYLDQNEVRKIWAKESQKKWQRIWKKYIDRYIYWKFN